MKLFKLTLYFCLLAQANLSIAQQFCAPNIIASAPDSRYVANANGTVLDKKTSLTWMRCALGQTWSNGTCTGSWQKYPWLDALQMAKDAVFAGKTDWRLPNQKELQSLVEVSCYDPSINITMFPNATDSVSEWFWSSSAAIVHFLGGETSSSADKNGGGGVRLVREG
jgi:hypothetical protein